MGTSSRDSGKDVRGRKYKTLGAFGGGADYTQVTVYNENTKQLDSPIVKLHHKANKHILIHQRKVS